MRHIFGKNEPLSVTEISQGNLNTVFDVRARADLTRNVIVKQAPPYLYSMGESWMLDPIRAHGEARALQFYNQIVPEFTPERYGYDPERYVIVMQNLDTYVTWSEALINGQMDTHVAHDIGMFLAHTLGYTANLMQNEIEKKHLQAIFNNAELHQMTLDYVFTLPFQQHESNHYSPEIEKFVIAIQQDESLTNEVQKMRSQFATCQQALIHGDLHTGSIMVSPLETKIIDPEFISVGPMSFDVGALIGNLWLSYAAHEVRTPNPQERTVFRHYLETMIRDMWQMFISELESVGESYRLCESGETHFNPFVLQLLKDVAGMAGCINQWC